jgi:mycothiol synthase
MRLQIRELAPDEVERVGSVLGLARLGQGDGHYLVAWEDDEPLGHAYLALTDPPELQDVAVRPEHRRRGVAMALARAAEQAVVARGSDRLRLSVGIDNAAAQTLYGGLGYVDVGIPLRHVHGTIQLRTGPVEVDATLLTWEKPLPATSTGTQTLGMDLPAGYGFRAPTNDDVDAVADVHVADQRADGVEPTLDAYFIRQTWSRPGFDLASDAWVVTDSDGTIVAYGQARLEEPDVVGSWGVVHPEHRGRGIGTALFDRIEARATVLLAGVPAPRFRHSINATDTAAAAMASARGLRPIRHHWHMQIDLGGPVQQGPPPEGIDIGGIDPSVDLRAIHAILVSAFADDPGDHPEPFDVWLEEHTARPSFDPTLWWLARDGGVPVGALIGSAGDDGGWVDWLAVLGSHRGRGIGAALLRRSFATFAERGQRRVLLNVDAENVTGATAVYERVGMRAVFRWDLWERSSTR